MAAVYVPTPRFGDDSLTDFHHGLLEPQWSLALTVATLVAALGVTAFGSLVFHF